MILVPGYITTEKIYEGNHTYIYRGYKEKNKQRVIIKILNEDLASPEETERLENEYKLLQDLKGNGSILAYSFEKHKNIRAIIFEEFGNLSLKELLSKKRLNLNEFLTLALHITEAVEKIHELNIIHKDINPSNILVDTKSLEIKIIDFGLATAAPQEIAEINTVRSMGGTLAYISPEQTGRINRGIDYRTDYYSLGVTLYEMATGILPFKTDDIGELIHDHIAKLPTSPHEINSKFPIVVSDIIMKCLAKTPDERYQSTFSLKSDLQNCLTQLKLEDEINFFEIGKNDIPKKFLISEKLYGRKEEISQLLDEFDEVTQGQKKLILVTGRSGIGKSTLVRELYKPLFEKRSYFIAGKFEQFKRDVPFSSLIQALQEMIQQILLESETEISIWKERIQKALGSNGQVMVEVIPLLSAIIGQQPPIPILGTLETENRFYLSFQNLIHALTTPEHPLVIFFDDCQWGDMATLKLLEKLLLQAETQYLMIIAAYRVTEINKSHSFTLILDLLKKGGVDFDTITLQPLKLEDVVQLLVDTFHQDKNAVQSLANVCYEKTEGNPFFLNQFLDTLYKEALIKFDIKEGKWSWKIEDINKKGITNNIIELMVKKIEKLPIGTKKALEFSACLGNQFNLNILAMIDGKSPKEMESELKEAIQKGLIIPINTSGRFRADDQTGNNYKFLHDRVQEAAYSLIAEKDRAPIHLKIGRLFLQETPKNKLSESIFEIVNQMNHGVNIITDKGEKILIAELNLIAAKKAKTSVAYKTALNYLKSGIAFLGENSWIDQYALTLQLYTEAAEVAYLSTEFAEMEKFSEITIKNAHELYDKIKIYETKITYLTDQNKLTEALDVGLFALEMLGIKLPKNPSDLQILFWLIRTKILFLGKTSEDIYNLPDMTDPHYKIVTRILSCVTPVAYLTNDKLLLMIILKSLSISVKYGLTPYSAHNYVCYGFILCAALNDIPLGYEFGQLAVRLTERFKEENAAVKALCINGCLVVHWKEHVDKSLSWMLDIFQRALQAGNLEFAGYMVRAYAYETIFSGKELNTTAKEIEKLSNTLLSLGQKSSTQNLNVSLQLVLNLLDSPEKTQLVGSAFDEREGLPSLIKEKDNLGISMLYSDKVFLSYLLGHYTEAYESALEAKNYIDKVLGAYVVPVFNFLYSLTCLAVYQKTSNKKQRNILLKTVKHNQKKMKLWSKYAPMNHLHKYYLVEAKLAYLLGDPDKAALLFDKAIDLAKENGYLHEEAMANEAGALFYLDRGRERIARVYMNDAYACYLKWGAIAKTKQIEQQHPNLLMKRQGYSTSDKSISSQSTENIAEILDLNAMMKATQTITGEIELENLLKKMMYILVVNSAAEKGILMLEKGGKWFIEAEIILKNDRVSVLKSIPIDDTLLPTSIIQYVIRTKTAVVVNDAIHDKQFSSNSYIQRVKSKSILCMPLIHQGTLTGVLYMENNLSTGAFTSERLELLRLLSGQITISIENASLYTQMKKLNQAYEYFVPKEFLKILGKGSILDVRLGDQVQKEMTVMFCDIRGFTTLSEKMTPKDTMALINDFLLKMAPIISSHHGFIDKYIGDGIMALYPTSADDALHAAISMLKALQEYNHARLFEKEAPIQIGIGLNTGSLVLGTVGDMNRMEGTVVSHAVNIASRVEELTRSYNVNILITEETYLKLKHLDTYAIRKIGNVTVRGKTSFITIYEVFDNDPETIIALKQETLKDFEMAVTFFQDKQFSKSLEMFQAILERNQTDLAAAYYIIQCKTAIEGASKTPSEGH